MNGCNKAVECMLNQQETIMPGPYLVFLCHKDSRAQWYRPRWEAVGSAVMAAQLSPLNDLSMDPAVVHHWVTRGACNSDRRTSIDANYVFDS